MAKLVLKQSIKAHGALVKMLSQRGLMVCLLTCPMQNGIELCNVSFRNG